MNEMNSVETATIPNEPPFSLYIQIGRIFQLYLIITLPVFLTLISVRSVMSPLFLQWEYNRSGFPEDVYGFTREDRMRYAPIALDYLLTDAEINLLSDLTFEDGEQLYNERELQHMIDVKALTTIAFAFLTWGGIGTLLLGILFWKNKLLRKYLRLGLLQGSILTLAIISAIVVVAMVAWDTFFTSFHQAFFESGTWRFAYSDTLIRLFPEQFWSDAALTIGILTTILAFIIMSTLSQWWLWLKRD